MFKNNKILLKGGRALKKVATFFALLILLSVFYVSAYAYKGNIIVDGKVVNYNVPDITITVDGNKFDTGNNPPLILDGNTIVPLRSIGQGLGASVNWDGSTQTITVTKGKVFKFFIGKIMRL